MYDTSHPAYTRLTTLGREITSTIKPKAILVLSAHWEGTATTLSINTAPSTPLIYDFGGFPSHYYRAKYPHTGSPQLAQSALRLLADAGIPAKPATRGLDHGVWVPFSILFNPETNPVSVPIVQLSLFDSDSGDAHYTLGEALAPLRDEGVLIIVSGQAVHNLPDFFASRGSLKPRDYALTFDEALKEAVEAEPAERKGKMGELLKRSDARKAHPTFEHLLPVFVGAGAAGKDKGVRLWTMCEGSVSWGMFRFGDLPEENGGEVDEKGAAKDCTKSIILSYAIDLVDLTYYICLELLMLTVKFEKLFESKRIMHYRAAEYMGRAEKLNSYIQTPATGAPTKNELRIISRSPPSSRIPLGLPQITSTKRFEDYIVQAENICGANNPKIFTKAEEAYKNLLSALNMLNLNISDGDNPLIPAIVRLCKASEAEGIVRLCNNFEIPILSFSNMVDGDYRSAIPRVTGSIVLDCGRYMNKALGVNEPGGYVVAEPGATYVGIDQYLVNKKLDQKLELNRSEHMVVLALGNIAESNMFTLYCGRGIILLNGDLLK
ncbi:hypothetical protein V498_10409, partial [Pseudogymnoascus sp. VKM F-4517 (FW-2822)]